MIKSVVMDVAGSMVEDVVMVVVSSMVNGVVEGKGGTIF